MVCWVGAQLQKRPSSPKSNLHTPVGCASSVSQLVKTAELDPSRNYVFGIHPHGVMVIGAFSNFCTDATGFSHLFPGLRPHLLMLPCWFNLPIFRDYIMCAGEMGSTGPQDPQFQLSPPTGSAPFFLEDPGIRSLSLCPPFHQVWCPLTRPVLPISCRGLRVAKWLSCPWEGPWRRWRRSLER